MIHQQDILRIAGLVSVTVLFLAVAACSTANTDQKSAANTTAQAEQGEGVKMQEIDFNTITGEETSLQEYDGKVVLLVNVASECGYTPQYAGLEELYRTYGDSGLVVLGFPANNFGNQEPGSNEEIMQFCETRFDVTFPMMAKVSVKGDDKHPLYVQLTEHSPLSGEIQWNFTKFLLDRDGQPVARFDSGTEPLSDTLVGEVKKLL